MNQSDTHKSSATLLVGMMLGAAMAKVLSSKKHDTIKKRITNRAAEIESKIASRLERLADAQRKEVPTDAVKLDIPKKP